MGSLCLLFGMELLLAIITLSFQNFVKLLFVIFKNYDNSINVLNFQ